MDYIAETKEIDISAPQYHILTIGLPMRTIEKALESKKSGDQRPHMASRSHFWTLLDYIAETKEIDISTPQNLILTNGLPMRTCEKALESKKVEAKDLIWPPEVILDPFGLPC